MSDSVPRDDSPIRDTGCRRGLLAGFLAVLAAGGFFAWRRFAPAALSDGRTCRVHDDDLARVSGFARFRR